MSVSPLKVWIVAAWTEAVFYGAFFCLWLVAIYLAVKSSEDHHSKIMTIVSTVMIVLATVHVSINLDRVLEGYTTGQDPIVYYSKLDSWSHVAKDTIYATQEILGNAAAVYRAWVLWNRSWRVILVPAVLLVGSISSGYGTCATFAVTNGEATVFEGSLFAWIRAFYAIAVVQNIITTSLMAWRIYWTYQRTSAFKTHNSKNSVMGILRILIESAALQLIGELILLILYSLNNDAQYILLETITPLVGITFSAITIRIRLHTMEQHARKMTTTVPSNVQTIGSMPLRRIRVDITQDIETLHDSDAPYDTKQSQERTLSAQI